MTNASRKSSPSLNRREFMVTTAAGALAALAPRSGAQLASRPNILFVCTDQQHAWARGSADSWFETPALDRLAREGTVFSHYFCTTPQCSPSRSSMYTGLYPHATGVPGNIGAGTHTGGEIPPMRQDMPTIGSRLKEAGYHTGYFGKWHLGNEAHFASHFDSCGMDVDPHEATTKCALDYLEARAEKEQPFALFVNYINPHDIYRFLRDDVTKIAGEAPVPPTRRDDLQGKPWPQRQFMEEDQGRGIQRKPEVLWQRYRGYYRELCRRVDGQFGQVLEALDGLGLADNTLVVYTSDHGDMDTNHNLVFKGPFMYEHLMRVPLVVRVPALLGGRHVAETDAFVTGVDFVPTFCALAGADAGESHGRSLVPLMTGHGAWMPREYVVSEYYGKQAWVSPIRMIRTREWKYNRYIHHGEELYDLVNDPYELHNLANDPGHAERKAELAVRLKGWMEAHGDTGFEGLCATDRKGKCL